jgi:two-component system, NarL family, nitrate/nitrite response regulator NarL
MTDGPARRGGGGRLLVLLRARDPVRRDALRALLAEAGHAVVEPTAASWDVALVDLAPGEEPPELGGGPLVLLADPVEAEAGAPASVSLLPRNASAAQIAAAVAAAAAGLVARLPGMVAPGPGPGFGRDEPPGGGGGGASLLTPREVEILAMIGDGASNKAVARRLGISAHTVKFHLEAVFRKLGVTTRAEAVARGLRQRLIEM